MEGNTAVSAREALFNDIWDMRSSREKNALIDAYRDEVALEIGRDALRDGLVPTLIRLVGDANATKLMADFRDAYAHEMAEQIRGKVQRRCVNDSDGDGDCATCARDPQALCRQPTAEGQAFARAARADLAMRAAVSARDERPQHNPDWQCWEDAADRIDPLKDAT